MRGTWMFIFGAACGLALAALVAAGGHVHRALLGAHGRQSGGAARAHTEEKFSFTANAPMDRVAPLFGADKEQVWAPGWNPQFVYPSPAADQQGMVFTVAHDHLHATWVNTEFDIKTGRMQYVYVIPDALVTVISVALTPDGQKTKVEVSYQRTALSPDADAHVRHMAEGDRNAGLEWDRQINGYLQKSASQ